MDRQHTYAIHPCTPDIFGNLLGMATLFHSVCPVHRHHCICSVLYLPSAPPSRHGTATRKCQATFLHRYFPRTAYSVDPDRQSGYRSPGERAPVSHCPRAPDPCAQEHRTDAPTNEPDTGFPQNTKSEDEAVSGKHRPYSALAESDGQFPADSQREGD